MNAKVIGLPISEATLHKLVSDWLDLALMEGSWYTTFPLGSGGMIRGAQLKARGTKKGTPDILIVHQSQAYFIELKTRIGKLNDGQIICHDDLAAAGARVATCRSLKEVAMALKEWRIPYRIIES